MRRLLSSLLAAGLLLALCGCSSSYVADTLDRYTESQAVREMLNGADGDYALSTGTTMPSETLIDEDGLLVRVTGIDGTMYYPKVYLAFDKGNNLSLWLDIDYALVNGWQVAASDHAYDEMFLTFHNYASRMRRFSGYVQANASILYENELLTDVAEIAFSYTLTVEPNDSSEKKVYEGVYSAKTSAAGESGDYVCDGKTLLEAEDIRVQLFSLENGSTAGGEDVGTVLLYAENNSDARVAVTITDLERNGESAYTGTADGNLVSGARALLSFELGAFARPIAVEDGDELTFTLTVYDYDAYCESDPEDETVLPPPLAAEEISLTVGED